MSIRNIGVIGAGTMGGGIAQVAAAAGFNITLVDVSDAALTRGIDAAAGNLARMVAKGKMTAIGKEAALGLMRGTTAYDDLKPVDIVIEAATESFELKAKIFKTIDELVRPDAIIASNTSSVSLTKL